MSHGPNLKRVLRKNVETLSETVWGRVNKRRLAVEAQVSLGTAQRIFAGETSVGLDVLEKLAALFRVAPAQLLQEDLGSAGFSPMACSLAGALDKVEEDEAKRRAWTLAIMVIERRDFPIPPSVSRDEEEHLASYRSLGQREREAITLLMRHFAGAAPPP